MTSMTTISERAGNPAATRCMALLAAGVPLTLLVDLAYGVPRLSETPVSQGRSAA